ncbi:MAG: alkaline phosphatase family protein [Rhizobiaceae bacterium]
MGGGNVLFITLDQMRADILRGRYAGLVPTPNMDRLAQSGVTFESHFTVTVPCGPARASLLTGLYAMNHRSIRNGTPLARHHATLATEARKAGYEPLLFGYTDSTPDPTGMDPEDPDLRSYEGLSPGFRELVEMRLDDGLQWPAYLRLRGYPVNPASTMTLAELYRPVPEKGNMPKIGDPAFYKAQDSDTAYLTDRTLEALDIRQNKPWFAHLTYIRPHPPLVAPEPWNRFVDPASLPQDATAAPDHPFMDAWFSEAAARSLYWGFDGDCANMSGEDRAALRAVYFGLVGEVDHHLGRVLDWLDETGQADRTLIIFTADHGEMLGDKKMWGKESVFDAAFSVPLIIRDPSRRAHGGKRITRLTESVDIAPTILDWIGRTPPDAMDGKSLLTALDDKNLPTRTSVLMEADFSHPDKPTRFQRHMGLDSYKCHATILREEKWKYIHFGGGVAPMLFDMENDPDETCDLAREHVHAGQVARMRGRLIDRMNERRDRRLTQISIGT